MEIVCFETMSDREVVERLAELLRQERQLTAAVLAHLGEVEARRLYLPAACPSMFAYCTRVLGMSEDQAFKRIRGARAARRYAVVARAIEEGQLHLSGVVLLAAPHGRERRGAGRGGERQAQGGDRGHAGAAGAAAGRPGAARAGGRAAGTGPRTTSSGERQQDAGNRSPEPGIVEMTARHSSCPVSRVRLPAPC